MGKGGTYKTGGGGCSIVPKATALQARGKTKGKRETA